MIWKCWDEDAALGCFSPHAVYTAVLSESPGTTKDIISLVMQQLEIAGNLCHSVLSSSYKNEVFLEPVTQRSRRRVQDTPRAAVLRLPPWLQQEAGVEPCQGGTGTLHWGQQRSPAGEHSLNPNLPFFALCICRRMVGFVCCHQLSRWLISAGSQAPKYLDAAGVRVTGLHLSYFSPRDSRGLA